MYTSCSRLLLKNTKCREWKRLIHTSNKYFADAPQKVFDRRAKLLQLERAASNPEVDNYDFLKEEIGYRLSDRLLDVARKFDVAVDIGSGRGWVTRHMTEHSVGRVTAIDLSPGMLGSAPESEVQEERIIMDVDGADLPFPDNSVDVVSTCLSMHWVNDLPRLFKEINRILKPDGVFIGAMFGGDTLMELRVSLQLAELEREGGFSPHISPFVEVKDLGSLLNRSKFKMITIDTDDLKVRYPTIFQLMRDLRGMAENNSAHNRKLHLHRESMFAANAIYGDIFANDDGSLPASFQIYYWIGWKAGKNQPQPLAPHKSDVSFKDIGKLDEIAHTTGKIDLTKDDK